MAANTGGAGAKYITVLGAAEHNLRDIDVRIPRDQLVVITGISGSGKSSLAFDTIYAEGQRKYVESLSVYARQFLQQLAKPHVEHIEGLPPTIAIQQRTGGSNPRSTVATTTEIYDYLRLLFARVGTPHCWKCEREITSQTVSQMVDAIGELPAGTRFMVLSPVVRDRKGRHEQLFSRLQQEGFVRARIDGALHELKDPPKLRKNTRHTVEVVVDRLVLRDSVRDRLADSIQTAVDLSGGLVVINHENPDTKGAGEGGKIDYGSWEDRLFSATYACPFHPEVNLPALAPRMFSFNSPYGACPGCDGLGTTLEFDPELVVPDPALSLTEGAIDAWRRGGKRMNIYYNRQLRRFCRMTGISPAMAFEDIPVATRDILMYGDPDRDWEGVIPNLDRRWRKTDSEYVKARLHGYMAAQSCDECGGMRLRPESRAVLVGGRNICDVVKMTISDALAFFRGLKLGAEKKRIAEMILREIVERLTFLDDVGLAYLSLGRNSASLSGGESQRIRLATQVGSGLVGVCYVLDEPTIGLHQRDNRRLIDTLAKLRDTGNTVLVVEHDEEIIRAADLIVDMGPGAGAHGGEVVVQGDVKTVSRCRRSLTGSYLSGGLRIQTPEQRRDVDLEGGVRITGCRGNNLKDLDVTVPLGGIVCVTGVSGSGKSTLVNETLLKALKRRLNRSGPKPLSFGALKGSRGVDKVIEIDQSPIGRTPRSNPATYTGLFDHVRRLFAETREAKIRGYKPGRFSFNVKGGRCEACQGQGRKRIEMHFLPDVFVECQECGGARYNRETLQVRFKGLNIADVLDMRVSDGLKYFGNFPNIHRLLKRLASVGLGYIKLGQSSTTLSGGEAQRVKLASELGKKATGHTFYVLDEPTTGLHFADIHKLMDVLDRLADMGNTIVIIEHHMDVIKCADWIIDLGPEGGEAGGRIVAEGRPATVVDCPDSYTGHYLRKHLETA